MGTDGAIAVGASGAPQLTVKDAKATSTQATTIQDLVKLTECSWQLCAQALQACGDDAQRCHALSHRCRMASLRSSLQTLALFEGSLRPHPPMCVPLLCLSASPRAVDMLLQHKQRPPSEVQQLTSSIVSSVMSTSAAASTGMLPGALPLPGGVPSGALPGAVLPGIPPTSTVGADSYGRPAWRWNSKLRRARGASISMPCIASFPFVHGASASLTP